MKLEECDEIGSTYGPHNPPGSPMLWMGLKNPLGGERKRKKEMSGAVMDDDEV